MKLYPCASNESGAVLVTSLLVMLVLVVMGTAALNVSNIEMQIAANTRQMVREFYTAESAWQEGVKWLSSLSGPPLKINTGTVPVSEQDNVKNFGNNGTDPNATNLNHSCSANTEDGTLYDIPYWFKVAERHNETTRGGDGNSWDYYYEITGTANNGPEVLTVVKRIYNSEGYNK